MSRGPLKLIYVYNGIREKWSRIKWYTRSICTLLYINFDGLYIIMNSPYRSLCTKFIIYAIILYGYQIVRRSFFMAPNFPVKQCCTTNSNIKRKAIYYKFLHSTKHSLESIFLRWMYSISICHSFPHSLALNHSLSLSDWVTDSLMLLSGVH